MASVQQWRDSLAFICVYLRLSAAKAFFRIIVINMARRTQCRDPYMSEKQLSNVNVLSQELLPTPEEVKRARPLTERAEKTVLAGREAARRILDHADHRLFVVVGPCSIHDLKAADHYAARLKKLADEVSDTLLIIMRVYFEKPRTTVGWKGLLNDPDMDDSFHIEKGLYMARE